MQAGPDVGDPTGTTTAIDSIPLLPTPTGGASAQQGGTLVIVIGDDAPDPAYFTSDPFGEEPIVDDTAPVDESIDGEGIDTGASVEEAPVEDVPTDEVPVDEVPVDEVSDEEIPAE